MRGPRCLGGFWGLSVISDLGVGGLSLTLDFGFRLPLEMAAGPGLRRIAPVSPERSNCLLGLVPVPSEVS